MRAHAPPLQIVRGAERECGGTTGPGAACLLIAAIPVSPTKQMKTSPSCLRRVPSEPGRVCAESPRCSVAGGARQAKAVWHRLPDRDKHTTEPDAVWERIHPGADRL